MIEIGEIGTPGATPHPHEPPALLVVQSPARGWLLATLPPALILLGGLAIASHQLRPDPVAYAPLGSVADPVAPVPLVQAPEIEPGELSVRVEPPTATAVAPPDAEPAPPPPDTEPSPPELVAASEPVPPPAEPVTIDPVAAAGPPQPAAPEPSRAQIILDDIEDEAREAQERKQEMEQLRGRVFMQKEQAAEDRLMRARMTAENDRGQFLSDLATLLRRHGRKSGPYITELAGLYGRHIPPQLQKAAEAAREQLDASQASPQARVAMYRRLGLSEICILDELSHQYAQAIGSRKGPRNREEVLYFAARLLVTVPLEPAAPQPAKVPAP